MKKSVLVLALFAALLVPVVGGPRAAADQQLARTFTTVTGFITTQNGSPVEDADVRLLPTGTNTLRVGQFGGFARIGATSNHGGDYFFQGVPPGDYEVLVTKNHQHAFAGNVQSRAQATTVTFATGATVQVDVVLPNLEAAPVLFGQTLIRTTSTHLSRDTELIPGATISLSGNGIQRTTTTSEASLFFFDVPPGDYELTATGPSGEFSIEPTRMVTVQSAPMSNPTYVELVEPTLLRLTVRDQQGSVISPTSSALVELVSDTQHLSNRRAFLNDGNIHGAQPGSYQLRITYDGKVTYWPNAATAAGAGEFVVPAGRQEMSLDLQVGSHAPVVRASDCSELLVGAPNEAFGQLDDVGAVTVLDITAPTFGDLELTDSYLLHQNRQGVPGRAEADDRFGTAMACGDFNGDGKPDVAVGAPGEDFGATVDAGVVHVFNGTTGRFSGANSYLIHQNTPGVAGGVEAGDSFGAALAVTDIDGDHFDDLVVGAPGEGVGTRAGAGAVHILYGSKDGLTGQGDEMLVQGLRGLFGWAEAGDEFGAALAVFSSSDNVQRLAIGVPGEGIGSRDDAGLVHVLPLRNRGNIPAGQLVWSQHSPDVVGAAETGDRFGETLAAIGGGLAVGAPGEDIGNIVDAGAATLFLDATATFDARYRPLSIWQGRRTSDGGTFGGQPSAGDRFGSSFSYNSASIAIGSPGEDVNGSVDAGAVHFAFAVMSFGELNWGQFESLTLADDRYGPGIAPGTEDGFGTAVAEWLAPNSPGIVPVRTAPGRNGGTIFIGFDDILVFDQATTGVPGAAESGDGWGSVILPGWKAPSS